MGPIALGYYSLAFMLISMPVEKIVAACNYVTFPIFCRMSQDRKRVREWYLRLAVLFGFLATPALVGLALVANDAILVVLGAKWTPAVLPVQIMSLAGLFMVLGSSIDVLYAALGRPDVNFRFTAISAIVFSVLFYLSGRAFGLTGVALVWAVCYPTAVLWLIGATRSITGIGVRDVIRSQVRVWASVLFMALVVLATRYVFQNVRVVPVRLGISILAGVLSYATAIRVLAWETVMGNVRLLRRELRSREVVHDVG
jgi:PST family polysaccharide transporter